MVYLLYLREGEEWRRIRHCRAAVLSNRFVSAEFEGVTTMEAAEKLKGTVLFARREDLHVPDGTLLVAELIGLEVKDHETGERLGVLSDVIHPGATDIYVIKTDKGEAMVPVVPEFVRAVDMENGILIAPIEGMF